MPPDEPQFPADERYYKIVLSAISVCKLYMPSFGQGSGAALTLEDFQSLHQADIFYSWFGLDSPLLYDAHRAAGGMTSLYRQIGLGCERLVRQVIMDSLGLTAEMASWSYELVTEDGKRRTLSLDGRIPTDGVSAARRTVVATWLAEACQKARWSPELTGVVKGAVFEVRQGYKSKDSKRQKADMDNASAARREPYLPVMMILSNQIDDDIALRYAAGGWLLLRGTLAGSSTTSTYQFCEEVVGYDIRSFFQRQSPRLRMEVEGILKLLLGHEDQP